MVLPNLSGESGCCLAWEVDGKEKVIYLRKAEFDKLDDILSSNTDGKIDLEGENCYIKIESKTRFNLYVLSSNLLLSKV